MKKATLYAVFLFSLALFLSVSSLAYSQGSLSDLNIQNTGLLPGNPFYFVKEGWRSLRRKFIANNIKQLDFDLDILNEKAVELKKLSMIAPNKIESITSAVANYEYSLDDLNNQLGLAIIISGTDFDRLINRFLETSFKHYQFLEELSNKFNSDSTLLNQIKNVEEKIVNLAVFVAQKTEKTDQFRNRFQELLNSQNMEFKEVRAAEFLDSLENSLSSGNLQLGINSLKKDLLLKFSVQLQQGLDTHNFNNLNADPMTLLKVLDEIRHSINDQDLKNQLNVLRQQFLDNIIRDNKISDAQAQDILDQATQKVALLQTKVKQSPILDQANFYLSQANIFWGQNNFSGVFSQAILAIGTVDDALRQLSETKDSKGDLVVVKKEYDRLMTLFKNTNFSKSKNKDIAVMFAQAEKLITKIGDKKLPIENLQDIKIILANIDLMLKK